MRRATTAVAAVAVAVLVPALLGGCSDRAGPATATAGGTAPAPSSDPSAAAEPTASPVLADACLFAGTDPQSTRAETVLAEAGLRVRTSADLDDLLDTRCALVVSVATARGEEMLRAAREHPDLPFAAAGVPATDADPPNLARLGSDLSGAAFVAGYLAAASTPGGVVGAVGLRDDPAAAAAVAAFAAGADHRASRGEPVEVRGARLVDDQSRAAQVVQRWADEGASVVLSASPGLAGMPVPPGVQVVGVGEARPGTARIVVDLSVPALSVAQQVADGAFAGGVVEGSLADGGVRVELGDVAAAVRADVDAVAEQVASGRMAVVDGG